MATLPYRSGMIQHPYKYPILYRFGKATGSKLPLGRGWVHHPHFLVRDALRAGSLATAIGQGNLATRNFRQKPIVGLIKAEHKRAPQRSKGSVVAIPTISQRRTKNILLTNSKAMPYRRKTYARRRPRTRKRYIKRRKPKIPLGFPRKKIVRFRLFANNALSGAGGALATAMIKANSLNDPMGAAGTQLPGTLDQWAAFYEKYTVLGSKITVKFGLTTNTGPVHVGVHLHKNSTALTGAPHYREVGMTKMKILSTQKDQCTIVMKYSGKRFWHLGSITSDSEQEATFSTSPGDPTDIAYYHVFLQDVNGANNSDADYSVELEFICMLNEPINVARSTV